MTTPITPAASTISKHAHAYESKVPNAQTFSTSKVGSTHSSPTTGPRDLTHFNPAALKCLAGLTVVSVSA